MSSRLLISVAAAGVATLSLLSVNVHAETAELRKSVPVDQYDLSKQKDASELYARLQRAALVVCRPLESRELSAKRLHRACYNEALNNAVADIDNVRLTALHQSEGNVRIASSADRSRS